MWRKLCVFVFEVFQGDDGRWFQNGPINIHSSFAIIFHSNSYMYRRKLFIKLKIAKRKNCDI